MTLTRAEQRFNLKAVDIAAHHLQSASSRGRVDSVQAVQSSHRLDILYAWLTGADPTAIDPDSHEVTADFSLLSGDVMDLGCGQGDQTGALAALVAAHHEQFRQPTKIIGVDPGPADYGSPYTLRQAQGALLQNATLSQHLSFVLGKTGPQVCETQTFDTVVLAHSLWYFPSAQVLQETFEAIKKAGVKHLLLAEWAMTASHSNALPHLLAALLQGQSPLQSGNVQTPISPEQVKEIASKSGWKVKRELTFLPQDKLQDGRWEVDMARDVVIAASNFDARDDKTAYKLQQSVRATKYALEEAVSRIGKGTRSMDVWTAVLTPA